MSGKANLKPCRSLKTGARHYGTRVPKSPSHLYLISGDDEIRIHAQADALFHELAGENPDDFSVDVIAEDDRGPRAEMLRDVMSSVRQPAFMGGAKTIWLKQFSGFAQEPAAKVKNDPMGVRALAEFFAEPLPDDIFVILEGVGCDEKKGLAKACAANGQVIWCRKPTTGRKGWREEMKRCISEVTAQKGITLSFDALEALVDALGGDTTLIAGELEKLVCYMGGTEQPITAEAVRELCPPYGDQENWAIGDPVGNRDLPGTLSLVEMLMARDKDPDGTARALLYSLGRQFRTFISLRIYMAMNRLKSGMQLKEHLEAMTMEEKRKLAAGDAPFATGNTWRNKFQADQAMNYSPHELIQAICTVRDALLAINSGGMTPPVELERALLMILPKKGTSR